MIKFFRQIRKSLLGEGKTGKYFKYAVGEIVLVVIGILIALQINNWNQQRIEQALEEELLINLKNEFITNQKGLNEMITNHKNIQKGCEDFLKYLNPTQQPIDEKDFDGFIGITGWTPRYNPQRGVLNSTLNSGKIGLIKNDSLVFNLSSLSSPEDYYYDNIALINKLTEDNIIPILLEHYSYVNIFVGELTSKVRSNFNTNQTAILQNRKMESLIYLKKLNTEVAILSAESLYNSYEVILRLIDTELKRINND